MQLHISRKYSFPISKKAYKQENENEYFVYIAYIYGVI